MNVVGLRSTAAARQPLGLLLRQHPRPSSPRLYTTLSATTHSATTTAPFTVVPGGPEDPEEDITHPNLATTPPPTATTHPTTVSVVLSRPPLLTRDLHPFEESFYFYQRRLNQRLALPFTRYFYIKSDTPAEAEWKRKQAALGEDVYTGFGKRGWADELLVGDDTHREDPYERLVRTTVTGEEGAGGEEGTSGEPPRSRRTAADEAGDRRSLNRELTRTLYLLVKTKGRDKSTYGWRLPQSMLVGEENLKQAAERTLKDAAGVNMNTWFVGNAPIGYNMYNYPSRYKREADNTKGKKVFYMKARIMAGQADLSKNTRGLEEFMWLTKQEINEVAGLPYYNIVKSMLVAQ